MNIRPSALCIRQQKVLLVSIEDEQGPCFRLPGGEQLPGESIEESLHRELFEGMSLIGVLLQRMAFLFEHIAAGEHLLLPVFSCLLPPGVEPELPAGAHRLEQALGWIPLLELASTRLLPVGMGTCISRWAAGRLEDVYVQGRLLPALELME